MATETITATAADAKVFCVPNRELVANMVALQSLNMNVV
jgi:hypothetical protein